MNCKNLNEKKHKIIIENVWNTSFVEHKTIKNAKSFNLSGKKPKWLKNERKKTKILPWFLREKLDDALNLAKW